MAHFILPVKIAAKMLRRQGVVEGRLSPRTVVNGLAQLGVGIIGYKPGQGFVIEARDAAFTRKLLVETMDLMRKDKPKGLGASDRIEDSRLIKLRSMLPGMSRDQLRQVLKMVQNAFQTVSAYGKTDQLDKQPAHRIDTIAEEDAVVEDEGAADESQDRNAGYRDGQKMMQAAATYVIRKHAAELGLDDSTLQQLQDLINRLKIRDQPR